MFSVLRRIPLAALSMLLAACASGGAVAGPVSDGTTAAAANTSRRRGARRVTPPRMVTRGILEMRGSGALRISVVVGADGQPRMGTLRVNGSGAGTQQAAIEQWIQTSTFEPGRQGAEPVDAVFSVQLKPVTRVRRI